MQRFQKSLKALGSDVVLTLIGDHATSAEVVLGQLHSQIAVFESRFSRFLPDSELSVVNRTAGSRTTVTPQFAALMRSALDFARRTNGLYNPAILPQLQRAGYAQSLVPHATAAPDYSDRRVISYADIRLEGGELTLPKHCAIDFGGIGKGYLAAELASRVPASFAGLWISLGGDIVCRGLDVTGRPFEVGVASAMDPAQNVAALSASGRTWAVATSGITKRRGIHHGKPWHHLIDPRTLAPAETDLLCATVTADDPVSADVAAKCIVIAGSREASVLMRRLGVRQAVLQTADGRVEQRGEWA